MNTSIAGANGERRDQVEEHDEKTDDRTGRRSERSQQAVDPFHGLIGVQMPFYVLLMEILTLALYDWSWKWWVSGAPLLTVALLSGRLGRLSTSPLLLCFSLVLVNVIYALFSTSWLFYDFYIIACYPTICFVGILSSRRIQRTIRRSLRFCAKNFHFYEDKLAFFDIPALDIDDGDVPCLLVIRGFTFTVSTMTLEVHGIEVGVKINDDIDIAIQTDRFTWKIMREISIGEVYGSLKGPFTPKDKQHITRGQNSNEANEKMTDGHQPDTTQEVEMTTHSGSGGDQLARDKYIQRMRDIDETNTVHQARRNVLPEIKDINHIRSAIAASIHEDKTVPNPPKKKIKSSDLVKMVPSALKKLFENVPVLLRIFLCPVSYNHPVNFEALILTGDGRYVNQVLDMQLFKYYPEENKEIRKLRGEVENFLGTGKFSAILPGVLGLASVPFLTHYDIITYIKAPQVLIFKANVDSEDPICKSVDEIAKVTGMAATFTIPFCLMPNHEDLLPDPPSDPNEPDSVDVQMSLLGSLPIQFHPEMIDFAITIAKASQVLTLHKKATSMSQEVHSAKDFTTKVGKATLEQTKKKLVEAHVDDEWLHKLIIKGFAFLKKTKGDAGYQMPIPVYLDELRTNKTYVRRKSYGGSGSGSSSSQNGDAMAMAASSVIS